jgi:hypothetical protein
MTMSRKLILYLFLQALVYSGFAGKTGLQPKEDEKKEKNLSCIPIINSFTDSLLASQPCSKYKFTLATSGTRLRLWINYGDGSPNDSVTILPLPASVSFTHQYMAAGSYTATAYLDPGCGPPITATLLVSVNCGTVAQGCPTITSFVRPMNTPGLNACVRASYSITVTGVPPGTCLPTTWQNGAGGTSTNCTSGTTNSASYFYPTPGVYIPTVTITGPGTCIATATLNMGCAPLPCTDCISSFAPVPGKTYVVSGWVKEKNAPQYITTYTNANITIVHSLGSSGPYVGTGQIIDGWQRVEGLFQIPSSSTNLGIKLDCITGDCYFDDIRVFPFDGSMKSYVYDPVTMRLTAELDERNYATLYEYDEEGKLIRIKKETEKGVMTIQENANNTSK